MSDPTQVPNHSSPAGAAALAKRISAYWIERGFTLIATKVVEGPGGVWNARSNVGAGGWPPGPRQVRIGR